MYAMYRFEKDLPEKLVAVLYATGFVSAALSAPFAGELADRYGRRLACQVYCVTYTLACLSMISNNLMVLLLGRLFGGVSTTLLFSVFEAWMITDYHRRGLEDEAGGGDTLPLGTVFAHLTTISSTVAVLSGVLSDMLVTYLASRVWPFMASIVCCCLAWCLMRVNWVRFVWCATERRHGDKADVEQKQNKTKQKNTCDRERTTV